MIFVSDGVLINGEEIIKRGTGGRGCGSGRATIKIENWVDPEAPMKSYSGASVSTLRIPPFPPPVISR